MKMKLNRKGFTLIELLIVIVIIGVLALALLPTILSGPAKARDAARMANLNKIKTAYIKAIVVDGEDIPDGIWADGADSQDADDVLADFLPIFPGNDTSAMIPTTQNIAYAKTIPVPGVNTGKFGITAALVSSPDASSTVDDAYFMIYSKVEKQDGNVDCNTISNHPTDTQISDVFGRSAYAADMISLSTSGDCYATKIKVKPEAQLASSVGGESCLDDTTSPTASEEGTADGDKDNYDNSASCTTENYDTSNICNNSTDLDAYDTAYNTAQEHPACP